MPPRGRFFSGPGAFPGLRRGAERGNIDEAVPNQLSKSAGCRACIAEAISVTWSADLQFGDIVPGSTSGTVTVSPAGVRTVSGGVTALGGSYGAASFTVSGEPGWSYTVTLPLDATMASGSSSMVVDAFTSSLDPDRVGTLDAAGNGTFTVGATLHVDAGQAPGTYSGSFLVSVDYQ